MHRKQNHRRSAKCLKNKKGCLSSVKGVSHLSRRAKRRLFCKLKLWIWRRQRKKCRFGMYRTKKSTFEINPVRKQPQKNEIDAPVPQTPHLLDSPFVRDSKGSEETLRGHNYPQKQCELVSPPKTAPASSRNVSVATDFKEPRSAGKVQRCDEQAGLGTAVTAGWNKETNRVTDRNNDTKPTADVGIQVVTKHIHAFLEDFRRTYGSFIPLHNNDVIRHLKKTLYTDFSARKTLIFSAIATCKSGFEEKPVPSFRVVYRKHSLTLDDLSTLADQNWLNDQVMNMYGELIMESSNQKVHFLNSFFHRQLMTKGYDGVKRWTKQVDLFSKSLLLVPIHLEVHWCLVVADIIKKKIFLFDSQGNALQKVARNILKYLITEAKEKKQADFESGWAVSFDEEVPQQTNENDCGVFVLEYSRCLALANPLQFSQRDIPKIRKRIYKELVDCRLREQG